jgi:hypothetical protein
MNNCPGECRDIGCNIECRADDGRRDTEIPDGGYLVGIPMRTERSPIIDSDLPMPDARWRGKSNLVGGMATPPQLQYDVRMSEELWDIERNSKMKTMGFIRGYRSMNMKISRVRFMEHTHGHSSFHVHNTEPHRTIHEPVSVHSLHVSPDTSSFLGDVDPHITVTHCSFRAYSCMASRKSCSIV